MADDVRGDDDVQLGLATGSSGRRRNSWPTSGMSPSSGTFDLVVRTLSWVSPPMTKVSPSRTEAEVSASRWLIVG